MVKRFHLLNGETIDLKEQLTYPVAAIENEYHGDWADGSNPWWLDTLDTDNGSQTINDLASAGGQGTTTLQTGGTNAGDLTNLEGVDLNWDNWSELWFYTYNDGSITGGDGDVNFQLSLCDNRDSTALTDGFAIRTNTNNQSVTFEVYNSGTAHISDSTSHRANEMFGFRLFENADNANSTGHTIVFYSDWEPLFMHGEDAGFPSVAEYPLRVGAITADGTDRSVDLDGVYLGLMA